jgi:hypothetical protein
MAQPTVSMTKAVNSQSVFEGRSFWQKKASTIRQFRLPITALHAREAPLGETEER